MKIVLRIFALAVMLISAHAFCWGTTGHRTIAEIAERHLTKKAKKQLKQIIGNQKLAFYANWPDFIKSDTTGVYKETDVWHYVNVKSGLSAAEFESAIKGLSTPSLYSQIKKQKEIIKNQKNPLAQREVALKFLIHLVGDLHQPLHVGRAEDQGGNLIKLSFFKETTNLHTLWDTKLVDFQKYSYSEYAEVLNRRPAEAYRKAQQGSLENWFYESYAMASRIYAQTPANANYSYDYNYKFADVVDNQLYLGGVRLAKILNEIFS